MGLTAAEAFMLIAFILLFMLVAWRTAVEQEAKTLKEANIVLAPIFENVKSTESIGQIIRLVEEPKLQPLLKAVMNQPEQELQRLTDMVLSSDLSAGLDVVDEALEAGLSAEVIRRVSGQGGDLDALFENLVEMTSRAEAAEAALAKVEQENDRALRTGEDIARKISERAGDRIRAMGGRVLPNGDVIFPDSILFEAGRAEISDSFDEHLKTFCRLWFETLHEQRNDLDVIQLEGHASSEYSGLTAFQAFVANLDLSQRRAAAVFTRCLEYGGDDVVAEWARSSMAAIGYSSSRVIVNNGVEDRGASRRVVFAIKPKTAADEVSDILKSHNKPEDVQQNKNFPGQDENSIHDSDFKLNEVPNIKEYRGYVGEWIEGQAFVSDGDTITVEGKAVRLQGLHAEELDTYVGRQAKIFMTSMLKDQYLECWLNGEKSFDRHVGVCFLEGSDIAAALVLSGLGWDCPQFSDGRYAHLQSEQHKDLAHLPSYCLR